MRDLGFLALIAVWAGAAVGLKVAAASAGAYTSDLYDLHIALRNTVKGEFFRSYVYGNVMGDHGYLILFLLLPLYWLAPVKSFWVLVAVTPVVLAASAIAIRVILELRGHPFPRLVAIALIGFPGVFWAVHEPVYGFHPDTLALPLFAVAAVGITTRGPRSYDFGDWVGLSAFALLVLLKEEFALLGVIFAIPFLVRRISRRQGVRLALIAGGTAIAAFGLMTVARTPFNRGNETLVRSAWDRLMTLGSDTGQAMGVMIPLVVGVLLASAAFVFQRRLETTDLSVALVVAAKTASLTLVYDQLPSFTWHLVIPVTAAWYVLYRVSWLLRGQERKHAIRYIAGSATLLVFGVLVVDVPWYTGYSAGLEQRRTSNDAALTAFDSFAPTVGEVVVSVPLYDIHAWRNHDATFLPRGLTLSPRGISDAMVTDTGGPPPDLAQLLSCFELTDSTPSRELYLRFADCGMSSDRDLFDRTVGLPDPEG